LNLYQSLRFAPGIRESEDVLTLWRMHENGKHERVFEGTADLSGDFELKAGEWFFIQAQIGLEDAARIVSLETGREFEDLEIFERTLREDGKTKTQYLLKKVP
jgi:hypothetical protein